MLNDLWLTDHRKRMLINDGTTRVRRIRNHLLNIAKVLLDVASGHDRNIQHLTQLRQPLGIMCHRMRHQNMLRQLLLDVAFKENAVLRRDPPNSLHVKKIRKLTKK